MTKTEHTTNDTAAPTLQSLATGAGSVLDSLRPVLHDLLDELEESYFRVWVPDCGHGHSVFGLAAMLGEHPRVQQGEIDIRIFATSNDHMILNQASNGLYPEEIAMSIPGMKPNRHFYREPAGLRVEEATRSRCVFAAHDLFTDPPLADIDLVYAPSLTAHLPDGPKLALLHRLLHFAAQPRGLVVFAPDTLATPPDEELFEPIKPSKGIFVARDRASDWRLASDLGLYGAPDSPSGESIETLRQLSENLQVSLEELHSSREEYRAISEEMTRTNERLRQNMRDLDRAHADLENLFRSTQIPTVFVTTDLMIRRFTPAAREVFCFAEYDEGRPLMDISPRFREPSLSKRIREVMANHEAQSLRIERSTKDMPRRVYLLRINPYQTLDGQVDGAVLTFVDITEMEQARERANSREAQRATIARLGRLGIEGEPLPELLDCAMRDLCEGLSADVSMILEKTAKARMILSSSIGIDLPRGAEVEVPDHTVEKYVMDVYYPLIIRDIDDEDELTYIDPLAEAGAISGITTVLADGDGPIGILAVHSTSPRTFSESDVNFVHSVAHILRSAILQRRAEYAMAENEGRLRLALQSAPFPLFLLADDGSFKLVSDRAFELTGYKPHEPEEIPSWAEHVCPKLARRMRNRIDDVFESPVPDLDGVYTVHTADGHDREWEFHSAPMGYSSDGRRLVISIAADVTDKLERTRKLTAESRQKDDFLAMLGHELRNPLSALRSGATLLAHAKDEESLNRAQRILDRQTRHMTRLIDGLLDVSRVVRGKIRVERSPLELVDLVSVTIDDHRSEAERRDLELHYVAPDEPMWIDGDETRLAQILNNLLTNAMKFTPRGGTIDLRLAAEHGEAILEIEDTGIGIEDDLMPHIFEPFRQSEQPSGRPRGGLGLGLALVRGLVELHDGEVEATSDGEEKGSKFTIRLPLRSPPKPSEMQEEYPTLLRDFLLIEDHDDSAELLTTLLESLGHTVRVATTATEGLELLDEQLPEVVLCDIGLPDMSGHEVARAVRARPEYDSVVLMALSGYGRARDAEEAREAGFDVHLTKPLDFQRLARLLAELS